LSKKMASTVPPAALYSSSSSSSRALLLWWALMSLVMPVYPSVLWICFLMDIFQCSNAILQFLTQ
jgi:hypothetical protein